MQPGPGVRRVEFASAAATAAAGPMWRPCLGPGSARTARVSFMTYGQNHGPATGRGHPTAWAT
jgi:hypothetical protein